MELFNRNKNNKKPLIRQILDLVPQDIFQSCVFDYKSNKDCSKNKTYDQFVAMSFGQLNKSISLNDISSGIGVSEIFIKDLDLSQSPARSTMSDGNRKTDGKSILEHIQNCEIIEFNNCGHFPELEDTNRFVRLVNERFVS